MFLWYLQKGYEFLLIFLSYLKEIRNKICIDLYFKKDSKKVDGLTHFMHAAGFFLYPLKTYGFLMFSGGVERDQRHP